MRLLKYIFVYRSIPQHHPHETTNKQTGNIRVLVRVRPPLPQERTRKLPFKFVDSGLGVGSHGEGLCRALEVADPSVSEVGVAVVVVVV